MKKTIIIILMIFVMSFIIGIFTTKNINTQINIKATSKVIWEHLVSFDRYPEWNPFIKKISGQLSKGSKIAVTIKPPGKESMDFEPNLLEVNTTKELRWLGRVLLPKLFDGEHYFILESMPDGSTQFTQGENFSGILALILWSSIEKDTRKGFEEMNAALKIRSEAKK